MLHNTIREVRKGLKMKQEDLAKDCGLNRNRYIRFELGKGSLKGSEISLVLEKLGLSVVQKKEGYVQTRLLREWLEVNG